MNFFQPTFKNCFKPFIAEVILKCTLASVTRERPNWNCNGLTDHKDHLTLLVQNFWKTLRDARLLYADSKAQMESLISAEGVEIKASLFLLNIPFWISKQFTPEFISIKERLVAWFSVSNQLLGVKLGSIQWQFLK